MKRNEFSVEFDILYNNIVSDNAPGLNEYEKSLFLTQAQEQFVQQVYTGNLGSIDSGFEGSEKYSEYLAPLLREVTLSPTWSNGKGVVDKPSDLMYIVYEEGLGSDGKCLLSGGDIIPVSHDDLRKMLRNPFRGIGSGKMLRLLIGDKIELYSKSDVSNYTLRYLKYPRPIILEDLRSISEDLSINGEVLPREHPCDLPEATHRLILNMAIIAAKNVWKI